MASKGLAMTAQIPLGTSIWQRLWRLHRMELHPPPTTLAELRLETLLSV